MNEDQVSKLECPHCGAVLDRFHASIKDDPEWLEMAQRIQKQHSESGDCKISVN